MNQVFHPLKASPGRMFHALWIALLAAALIHLIILAIHALPSSDPGPRWKQLNWLMAFVFLMIYSSFWFTIKLPLSHIYFIFFPLLMTYSCYAWMKFKLIKNWRLGVRVFILLGVVFQFIYAITVEPRDSIYPNRNVICQAIQEKNYKIFGERRPGSFY